MDDSKIFPNFNLFSDFKTDDDITGIRDDITDEEIVHCVETIEKEQESVTNPPECRRQRKPENARFALLADEDLTTILSSEEAKTAKKNTKWIVGTIEGKYIFKKRKSYNKFPDERTV